MVEGFPWSARATAISLPVHVVLVSLNLYGLPNYPVHEPRLGGEVSSVLELNVVAEVDAAFGHSIFVWLLQMDMVLVLLDPGLDGIASLPDFLLRDSLIALMIQAVRTYETLVNKYQSTQRYNPNDSHQSYESCEKGAL